MIVYKLHVMCQDVAARVWRLSEPSTLEVFLETARWDNMRHEWRSFQRHCFCVAA